MNYELAKKLKDAGLEWSMSHYFYDGNEHECTSDTYPTLSELIEVCGDYFGAIVKVDKIFKAVAVGKTMDNMTLPSCECDGSTPEEAVANLWLALNKHD